LFWWLLWDCSLGGGHSVFADHPTEIVSLRTIDSKTFFIKPGERQIVIGRDLHYLDDQGVLQDIDLAFRGNNVSDQGPVIVSLTGRNLKIQDRATGVDIKYTLPENATVLTDTLSYNHKGLTWTYSLTKRGTKLSAVVSSAVGLETYSFPFVVTGTSASINNGRLEADEFVVTRPKIIDANGDEFIFNWVQDAGEIKFTFDDTGMALPYTIDPTTVFTGGASGDDGRAFVVADPTPWPPAIGDCDGENTDGNNWIVRKNDNGSTFDVYIGMVRLDTSAIPDTATIISGTLDLFAELVDDDDTRSFNGEYYATGNWPITCASDWVLDVGSTAFNKTLASITASAYTNYTLVSPNTNISKTGFTGFRMGISGGEPTIGNNQIRITSFDNGSDEPTMTVTYRTDPTISTFSPLKIDDASTEFVTLTGTDFDTVFPSQLIMEKSGESDILCTGENITGGGANLTATCDFTGAAIGLWDARVDNGSGHEDTLTSATTIIKIPNVTSATPAKVDDGSTEAMTVNGSNFESDAQVFFAKSGESDINCTSESVNGPGTQITATCDFTGVLIGLWDVRVENDSDSQFHDIETNEVTVIKIPNITTVTPDKVDDETTEVMTVNGTNFESDAQVFVVKGGESDIVCTAESVNGPGTQITTTCDFNGVLIGLWDVRVENDSDSQFHDTSTNETRVYSRPSITSISPTDAENNAGFTLTVNGSEFDTVDPAVVTLTRSGESTITCTGGTSSATVLTRSCPITGALEGLWSIVVTNGTVLAATLTDGLDIWSTLGTPTLTSVTPTLSSNTSPVNLTLFGANLDDADTESLTGAQVTMSGPGSPIICTGEDVTNGNTRVAATCDITSATTGLWQVTVTNNGGAQASIGFTVVGAGSSGSAGDPDGTIDDVFAYDSVLEDDDLLVVVVYNLTFTSTLPITDTFLCRFLASGVDQNASEILVFNDLGYGLGVCSFYWTAAQKLASSIEFENPNAEIYEAVLQGKASAFDIPLRFTNQNVKWRDPNNTSALLSRTIITLATRLQNDTAWAANSVVLLSFFAGITVFSSDGESYFGRVIPNLASMVPDLFSSSVTAPFINEREFGFSETERLQNFWDGSVLEDSMQAGGDLFNVDPIYFTTFIGLAIIIAGIAVGRVATGNLEFGLITTAVTIPLTGVVGLLSLTFVVMVAALAVLALGFVLFLRRAS